MRERKPAPKRAPIQYREFGEGPWFAGMAYEGSAVWTALFDDAVVEFATDIYEYRLPPKGPK